MDSTSDNAASSNSRILSQRDRDTRLMRGRTSTGFERALTAEQLEEKQAKEQEKIDAAEKQQKTQNTLHQWHNRTKRNNNNANASNNNNLHNSTGPIRFKTLFRNTILDVFKQKGYVETASETEWDIYWTNKEWIRLIFDRIHLDSTQKVNHFRNFYELTRKDLLIKNLKRTKRELIKKGLHSEAENNYSFFPETFSLPAEYSLFVETFKNKNNNNNNSNNGVYIMKPIGSSQGKGIFLFEKLSQISEWKSDYRYKPDDKQAEKYIVQKYINNPLLIGGKKFDLRIYVLTTSYQPLTCYMYREGFARFSSTRYSNERSTIHDNYVHLTNVAIQKTGENYDEESGGKWSIEYTILHLYLFSLTLYS